MKKALLLCSLFISVMLITGCETMNGQMRVDPNTAATVEAIGEASSGILQVLTPVLGPVAGGIGLVIAGALGAWRKVKPTLTEYKDRATHYHAATKAVVDGIEEFKASNPDQWKALEEKIEAALIKQNIPAAEIENIIRAIRGLPPKEIVS